MKRGWQWPAAVTAILAITVAGNAFVYYQANHDPSFAVEDDYYEKALDWDAHMAQESRNAALGWRLTPALSGPVSDTVSLGVMLDDSAGHPIGGATVKVTAMQVAHAALELHATLVPDPQHAGAYHARLSSPWSGWWELRFDVSRGTDHFTADLRRETSAR